MFFKTVPFKTTDFFFFVILFIFFGYMTISCFFEDFIIIIVCFGNGYLVYMHANGKLVTNVLSAAFTMLLVLILGILEWKIWQ